MDWRVKRLTQELSKHDRTLYAMRTNIGMVQIWREAEHWHAAELLDGETPHSRPTQFITALTDTWRLDGTPVDHGIEPVMRRIRSMDSWNKTGVLDEMRKNRERAKEDKARQTKNENIARAHDLRKDFAKAVNDINTSSLDMTDARRKHGDFK